MAMPPGTGLAIGSAAQSVEGNNKTMQRRMAGFRANFRAGFRTGFRVMVYFFLMRLTSETTWP